MPAGRPSSPPRVRRPDTGRPVLSARAGAALGVLVVLMTILAIPFKEWITQRRPDRRARVAGRLAHRAGRRRCRPRTRAGTTRPTSRPRRGRGCTSSGPGEVGYVVLDRGDRGGPGDRPRPGPMAQAPRGGRGGARCGPPSSRSPTPRQTEPARRPRRPPSRPRATAGDGSGPRARRARQPGGPRRGRPQLGRPVRGGPRGRAPLRLRPARRRGDHAAAARRHAVPDPVLPDLPAGHGRGEHAGVRGAHARDDRPAGDGPRAGRGLPRGPRPLPRRAGGARARRADRRDQRRGDARPGQVPARAGRPLLAAGPGVNPLGDEALALLAQRGIAPGGAGAAPPAGAWRARDGVGT